MSTVTAHTLFSRATRYSAGTTSLRCPKPAVVSLPFARNSAKKAPRSVCYYADRDSINHPSNISPMALVNPLIEPTTTRGWEIKEDANKLELTIFGMPGPENEEEKDFQVAVEGNVLVIIRNPPPERKQPNDDVLFHVRLLVPDFYDKVNIQAQLERRNLVVSIPKFAKPDADSSEVPFYRPVLVKKTK